jgi:protein SCO1/2
VKRGLLYGLYALAGALVLGVFSFVAFKPIKVLPRIRLSPGFSLTDQEGKRLTNEDLRGKLVLYNFTYTRCQPPCPQTWETMQTVQQRLGEIDLRGAPVQLVTISFDTLGDSPADLKAYAQELGVDTSNWSFAVGKDSELMKYVIGNSFEVYYAPNAEGGFDFDPAYVLVDGWGIIRGEYQYQTLTPDADRILRHIGVLAEEVQKSVGAARYAYEAAHLFLCYAP